MTRKNLDITNFDCSHIGDNTVTLTVTDNNNNSSTCNATVTVEDAGPTANCKNGTFFLDNNGDLTIDALDISDNSTDICGIASMNIDKTTFSCIHVGAVNNVTLTVTDLDGNIDQCVATINILDNTAPVALCQSTTVSLDANGGGSITVADIDNGSNDACGIASRSLDFYNLDCIEGNTTFWCKRRLMKIICIRLQYV